MTAPWAATPPEANYVLLARGAGEATTVANGASWQAQTVEALTHAGLSAANTVATSAAWIGLSGAASAVASTALNGALSALSGWSQSTVPIAEAAALAYRAAVSAMIPDVVCVQNRVEQANDVAINFFVWGALTPEIVRLDGTYFGGFWTENATQGITYSSLLTGFLPTLGIPPPVGPLSVSPAAPAAAAEAVAQATADGAVGDAMRESVQAGTSMTDSMGSMSSVQGLMEPVMSAAQAPTKALESLGQPLQQLASPAQAAMGMFSSFGQGGSGAAGTAGEPIGAAIMPGATAAVSGGGGIGGVGAGAYSGVSAMSSSYTRPTNSFKPETGGTPLYAKPGAVRPGGVSSMPVTGGAAPMGMMRGGGAAAGKESGKATKTVRLTNS